MCERERKRERVCVCVRVCMCESVCVFACVFNQMYYGFDASHVMIYDMGWLRLVGSFKL